LDELGEVPSADDFLAGLEGLDAAAEQARPDGETVEVRVRRICEPLQTDVPTLADLRRVGALPGRAVHVRSHVKGVEVTGDGGSTTVLTPELAAQVLVRSAGRPG